MFMKGREYNCEDNRKSVLGVMNDEPLEICCNHIWTMSIGHWTIHTPTMNGNEMYGQSLIMSSYRWTD